MEDMDALKAVNERLNNELGAGLGFKLWLGVARKDLRDFTQDPR